MRLSLGLGRIWGWLGCSIRGCRVFSILVFWLGYVFFSYCSLGCFFLDVENMTGLACWTRGNELLMKGGFDKCREDGDVGADWLTGCLCRLFRRIS